MTSSPIVTASAGRLRYPWLFGRNIDVAFFYLPLFFGLALAAAANNVAVTSSTAFSILVLNAFGAGPFHWGPTWFAYFDKRNREYWLDNKDKRVIFFAGPPLLMLFSIFGNVYISPVVQLISIAWAIQHLVQQNIGILLLYHNSKSNEAVVNRNTEIRSQHAPTIFFSAVFFYRVFLLSPHNIFFEAILAALLVWALYSVGAYIVELNSKVRAGQDVNVPAVAFWAMSVLSLVPLAFFCKNFTEGILIPVTIHWFQYIGLNYVLVKAKYDDDTRRKQLPMSLSPLSLFFVSCVFFWLLFFSISAGATIFGAQGESLKWINGFLMGLANCHYFLDAFLWRFRESYARETVLPFLVQSKTAAAKIG